MNPHELFPKLADLLGPDVAHVLVDIAQSHKISASRTVVVPTHVLVLLMEAACRS